MSLFLSHAKADDVLIHDFVDLLQTGCGVQNGIVCTSVDGMGIPSGKTFIDFIESEIKDAKCVILVITPSYYESVFCLCELGATWGLKKNMFPLIVPPLTFNDGLKAVLAGTQAGFINDGPYLDQLYELIVREGIGIGTMARWNVKKGVFIKKFAEIQETLIQTSKVSRKEYEELKSNYDNSLEMIKELEGEVALRDKKISDLKKCKDKTEVNEVLNQYSTGFEKFSNLVEELKDAINGIRSWIFTKVLYSQTVHGCYTPPSSYNDQTIDDAIDKALEYQYLINEDGEITVSKTNRKTQKVLDKLHELEHFMEYYEGSTDGPDDFEEFMGLFIAEYGEIEFDIKNREFWEKVLDL